MLRLHIRYVRTDLPAEIIIIPICMVQFANDIAFPLVPVLVAVPTHRPRPPRPSSGLLSAPGRRPPELGGRWRAGGERWTKPYCEKVHPAMWQ